MCDRFANNPPCNLRILILRCGVVASHVIYLLSQARWNFLPREYCVLLPEILATPPELVASMFEIDREANHYLKLELHSCELAKPTSSSHKKRALTRVS